MHGCDSINFLHHTLPCHTNPPPAPCPPLFTGRNSELLFQRQHIQTCKLPWILGVQTPSKPTRDWSSPFPCRMLTAFALLKFGLSPQQLHRKSSYLTATTVGIYLLSDFDWFPSYREEIMQGNLRTVKRRDNIFSSLSCHCALEEVQGGGMSLNILVIRSIKPFMWCSFPLPSPPQDFLLNRAIDFIPRYHLLFPSCFFVCVLFL